MWVNVRRGRRGAGRRWRSGSQAAANLIVVEGNRRVEADTIRSYFKLTPGEHLDASQINAALKALYATGLFQDVRISEAGGKIIVTVVESPVIDKIAFEGNFRLKDEQLKEEIQSKERGPLSKAMVQTDTQRIIEVYQRNGRFDVSVVPKIIERQNNRVDLVFEIHRRRKDRHQIDRLRRQQGLFGVAAEGRDQDVRIQLFELLADHGRL